MFKRLLLWIVRLPSSLLASHLPKQQRDTAPSIPLDLLFDMVGAAFIACEANGAILHKNASAQALFGPECAGLSELRYPNGQAVPPGQLPLNRARMTRESIAVGGYRIAAVNGLMHVVDISARPLPGGGAAAVFRDVTDQRQSEARESLTDARSSAVHTLCCRLNKVSDAEAIARDVVETVRLLPGLAHDNHTIAYARLYGYDPTDQTLTCLASDPDDRPKRPHTIADTLPPVFPFDATLPALWQIYIARRPCTDAVPELGEPSAASAYAVPLLRGGMATGHLSISSPLIDAFDDPALRETLDRVAALAALALAGPQAALAAAASQVQIHAVDSMMKAAVGGLTQDALADEITDCVRQIIGCEVCTLSVLCEDKLSLIGEAFQDDLLFPSRVKLASPILHGKIIQKALRTQKTEMQLGSPNPSIEKGLWRAFAGRAGEHSVFAVPLAHRQGVLAVYRDGSSPLPEAQVKFLETAAIVASLGLLLRSRQEATVPGVEPSS